MIVCVGELVIHSLDCFLIFDSRIQIMLMHAVLLVIVVY